MISDKRVLVVGAHSADWVWRSSGAIAKYTANGAQVFVVCLTFGARGESSALWKTEGQTFENVKKIRYQEAQDAAAVLGVTNLEMWDFDDCMLEISPEILQRLNEKIREVKPSLIITHDTVDTTNRDHGIAHEIVVRASIMAAQPGIPSDGLKSTKTVPIFGFEASEPERSGFVPDVYLDITDFYSKKEEAMKCIKTQTEGPFIHGRLNTHRGWQAARMSGNKNIKYVEVFRVHDPIVVNELPVHDV
ncbi:MAG: PIG-L family deacetylase [Synergistaceae bacterium]|jgi:4-oxalomesaconate hydratase|nr:PIG-L family deacetylase [Synergistaceae bacterium]